MGNPSLGFPTAKPSRGRFGLPLLSFWESGGFRPLRWARKGSTPPPRKFLKKLEQNFYVLARANQVLSKENLVRGVPAVGARRAPPQADFIKGKVFSLSRDPSPPIERREKGFRAFLKLPYLFFPNFLKVHFSGFAFFRGFPQPGGDGILFRIGAVVYLHFHGNTSISSYSLFPRICS